MNAGTRLSLRGLLLFIVLILMTPALLFGLAGFLRARAETKNLQQTRDFVNSINQSINQEILAPFYLSPNSSDPCDPQSLEMVNHPDNWSIKYEYYENNENDEENKLACKWSYYKDNELIAIDSWKSYDRKLGMREYYQNEILISTDTFFVVDDSYQLICIKQRTYKEVSVSECYSESGYLISVDPLDRPFSSLPPMLYWFSYR